jgi:hypothetical protein
MKRISTIREFIDADLVRFIDVISDAIDHDIQTLYFVPSHSNDKIPHHLNSNNPTMDDGIYVVKPSRNLSPFRGQIETKNGCHYSENLKGIYEAKLHRIKDIIEVSLHKTVNYAKAN